MGFRPNRSWLAALALIAAFAGTGLPATGPAGGQTLSGETDGVPIEVHASEAIEWHQDQKAYVARGDAYARRGDVTIEAGVLTAYYRKLEDDSTEIFRLAANGNVRITSPDRTVTGEQGVYDIDRDVAVLTGENLRLETPSEIVTARDSLEYWRGRNLAVARGDARVVSGENNLRADLLVARLEEVQEDQLEIVRVDAEGDVTIVTPRDTVTGERGVYDVRREVAVLTGDVRITRGPIQLSGDIAEVDLASGISRLLTAGSDRVQGLIMPQDGSDE